MLLNITQEDINSANAARETSDLPTCKVCPVAQALTRIGYYVHSVYPAVSHVDGKKYDNAVSTRLFINHYDMYPLQTRPGEVEILELEPPHDN